jgi:hypothetical protein
MTRYRWSVTVPPGTPQSAAVTNTIEVDEAVIQDGLVFAPPGSAGLVQAELLFGDLLLLPSPGSDRTLIPGVADAAPLNFEAEGTPFELTLRGFAPQTQFPHTITARVDAVQPANAAETVNIREADIFPDTDVSDAFEGLDTVESE